MDQDYRSGLLVRTIGHKQDYSSELLCVGVTYISHGQSHIACHSDIQWDICLFVVHIYGYTMPIVCTQSHLYSTHVLTISSNISRISTK